MTLEQLELVVTKKSRRRATILRDLDLDAFRAAVAGANDPARRLIVNFHRDPIFHWGGGHHAPIGGYLATGDRVFVLDPNRRVGPFLVETALLHAAVDTIDPSTRRRRGLLRVE
jgi:hypothetical protein